MFLATSESWGSAAELARQGLVYSALIPQTALKAYNATSAGALLYNGTGPLASGTGSKVNAIILGMGLSWTTAPGATGTAGIGFGITAAPSSTSATGVVIGNTNPAYGAATAQCSVYVSGAVTAATGFLSTHQVTATAAQPSANIWVPLDGVICLSTGSFAHISGSAAIATMVTQITLVWAEIPA